MSSQEDEINPFVDPTRYSGDNSGEATLVVGHGVVLTLAADSLNVLDDATARKRHRACCGVPLWSARSSNVCTTIAYHNILDTTHDSTHLTITYAHTVARRVIRPTILTYNLPKAAELDAPAFVARLLTHAYPYNCVRRKRIKLLINPFGGKGHAKQTYTRDIEPVFAAARCEVDVEITTHSGHARELAENIDIEAYDVIACCSGDGLPHEVFNGLGQRADARRALAKIAVVQLPCGTGNAMSLNSFGTSNPSLAALAMVKGIAMPLDLASVTQGDRRILSFLSQAVGICAEADLDTEHLRWMGDARFTYGLLVRLLGKTVYPCEVTVDIVEEDKEKIRARWQEAKANAAAKTPPPFNSSTKTLLDSPPTNNVISESTPNNDLSLPSLTTSTNSPIPIHWTPIPSDSLGNFYSGTQPLISSSTLMFPYALPSDGCLDLVMMNGDVPRHKALKCMLGVEDGSFVDMPEVRYMKVRAYRVVPKQKTGSLSVDGERLPFEAFQVEVHRGLGRTLTRTGRGFEVEVK